MSANPDQDRADSLNATAAAFASKEASAVDQQQKKDYGDVAAKLAFEAYAITVGSKNCRCGP